MPLETAVLSWILHSPAQVTEALASKARSCYCSCASASLIKVQRVWGAVSSMQVVLGSQEGWSEGMSDGMTQCPVQRASVRCSFIAQPMHS